MEAGARFPRRQGTGEAAHQLLQLPGGPRHQEHCFSQQKITSIADPMFYLKYLDVRVGTPDVEEGYIRVQSTTPHDNRLRDIT